MPLELVDTLATIGTFLVIAASAAAALLQLRHLGSSNQIAALTKFREEFESAEFTHARQYVLEEIPRKLASPAGRAELRHSNFRGEMHAVIVVANFMESLGVFLKRHVVHKQVTCDIWGDVAYQMWTKLAPIVYSERQNAGTEALWENFEYLAVVGKQWVDAHPNGAYPEHVDRMPPDYSLAQEEPSIPTETLF